LEEVREVEKNIMIVMVLMVVKRIKYENDDHDHFTRDDDGDGNEQ
jgi:hypothetical protein